MYQLYFLSIFLNLLGGGALASEVIVERVSGFSVIRDFFDGREKLKLIVGLLSILVGILKILAPVDDTPVVGDLFPALAGLFCGVALLVNYYASKSDVPPSQRLEDFFNRYGSIIGVAAVVFGLLHFFMPRILLL